MPPLALPVDHSCLADDSWVSAASSMSEVNSSIGIITRSPSATKKVTFSSNAEVYEVPNLNDFSKEEISAVWLTVEECQQIRENCVQVLKRVKRHRTSQDDCIRGLEGKHPKTFKIRKEAKRAAKMVVFKEQHHYNVDEIATIYHDACRDARVQAIHSAQQDEKSVHQLERSQKRRRFSGVKKQSLFSMFWTSGLVSQ
jgi:hypothetical protein